MNKCYIYKDNNIYKKVIWGVIYLNKLLLVIDLQNGFINQNTEDLKQKIKKLIEDNMYEKVLFTRFINVLESIWVKKLNYTGCLTKEEQALAIETKYCDIIDKYLYTAVNDKLVRYIKENKIDKIYICGIDTECCVLQTALDLFEDNYDIYILKDYCRCMHGEIENNQALEIIGRNIGENRII